MAWYYLDKDQQVGPFGDDEFARKVSQGQVKEDTYVWQDGMAEWLPLAQIENRVAPAASAGATAQPAGAVTCPSCGAAVAASDIVEVGGRQVCPNCEDQQPQRLREGLPAASDSWDYAGFWVRAGAHFIDGTVMYLITTVIDVAIAMGLGAGFSEDHPSHGLYELLAGGVSLGLWVMYEVYFLGKYGATPGKMSLKLKVIVADGRNISYLRAFSRFLAGILSTLLMFIGYLIVVFDFEKRALHDRICNTRVIRTG